MEKKNLLFISMVCPFPQNYGGKIGTWQKIKELSVNYNIFLCGLIETEDFVDDIELKKYCKSYRFFKRKKHLLKCLFNFWKPYSFVSRESKDLNNYISSTILKNKIKIIILDSIHMLYSLSNIEKSNLQVNVFVNEHNCEWNLFRSIKDSEKGIKRLVYSFESKKLKKIESSILNIKNVKGIILLNERDMNLLCFPKNKVCLIPPTVTICPYSSNTNIIKDKYDLLIVSNFEYSPNRYGLHWFIRNCFPLILNSIQNIKLAIVGRGINSEISNYQKTYPNNILTFPDVPNVIPYYYQSKTVIIPLFQGGGIKMKLLEAASLGKAIICTSKAVEGTSFDNDSVWVCDSETKFAENCLTAINEPMIRKSKGDKAQSLFLSNYSFDNQAKKYFAFISSKTKEQ